MDAKKLGEFIREQRNKLGISQKELANQINVTPQAVSKWERGMGLPDIENITSLSVALNVSVAEIMQGRQDEKEGYGSQEVANLMEDTITIVHEQNVLMRKNYILRTVLIIISLALIFTGIHFLISPYSQMTSNGSTAFFVVSKLPVWIPGTFIVCGIIILILSLGKQFISLLKRSKKHEEAT